MTVNILPDSRLARSKGAQNRAGVWWVPIYCAFCGAEGGFVPEENTTFIFWMCNPCFETHGEITNLYVMPDEVFWEKVKQEQIETYGRLLTLSELVEIVAADASPLATLIKQRR